MENLKGRTILVGKEPGNGRLLVAIQGNGKSAAIGSPGCVPACVSRCKPAEGVAHVKITVNQNGDMVLTNMKSQNVTYVNGSEIASKHVALNSTVELGKDKFNINLPAVINVAEQLAAVTQKQGAAPKTETQKKKFNISHLEMVWDDLQYQIKQIRAKQRKINLVRSGCGLFTLCAMPCIFMFGPIGYVLTGIGIVGNVYSFVGLKNDRTSELMEELNEQFQDHYVCPNPDCNKFLGNMSYRLMKKQYSMHCPYCKCEFVEK